MKIKIFICCIYGRGGTELFIRPKSLFFQAEALTEFRVGQPILVVTSVLNRATISM